MTIGLTITKHRPVVMGQGKGGCDVSVPPAGMIRYLCRNLDLTLLVHNNQVYGLTKGQASPTSDPGHVTKAQPQGVELAPFNPIAVAVAMHAGFVARSFAGMMDHLARLIQQALAHPGFALIDILQPCPSFNHVNTFAWYKQRCSELPADYDPENWETAMKTAEEWGERIPVGLIYRNRRPAFKAGHPPLVGQPVDREALARFMESFA